MHFGNFSVHGHSPCRVRAVDPENVQTPVHDSVPVAVMGLGVALTAAPAFLL